MKTYIGLSLLIFVVTIDVVFCGQYIGCYKENKRHRYFGRNPGDFDPGAVTPLICAAKCGSFAFPYAAIAEGRFCFCGDTLPDISKKDGTDTLCTDKCSGDPGTNCGSKDYVSVYSAAPPLLGLTLSSSAGGVVVPVHTAVTFSPGLTSGGADLAFKMDYDDGAGKTDKNATNMWQRDYHVPGHYKVSLFGNDVIDSLLEKEATTTVMVDAPVKTTTLTCPSYMATYEEDHCLVSILEGTNLKLEFFEDSVLTSSFSVADPLIFTTGPAMPTKGGVSLLSGEGALDIVMPASEFLYKSVITSFEAYGEIPGSIEILILAPMCTSPAYCYDKNDCSAGCGGVHEKTCASKEFCPSAMSCWASGSNTCDSPTARYDGTQRTDLTIVKTFTHSISTGYTYIPVDVTTDYVEVDSGYILGYRPVVGRLKAVSSSASESDIKNTNVGTKGTYAALSQSKRHLLRAVTSAGSNAYIPVKFTTAGLKSIMVTVSNTRITGSETNTTQIDVIEGIDKAVIDVPQYIEKGLATTFQLLPHTGTNINYTWDFDDGTVVNTSASTYSYTYTSVGQFNVTVQAFNQLSSKNNITTVYVQDRIRNFFLVDSAAVVGETTSIPVSMTTGSDYTCTWLKDGILIATTDDTTTPPGGTFDHVFLTEGSFVISVSCNNQINSMSTTAKYTTQYRITNLQLVKTGALKNTQYKIEWTWTAGTIPSFNLEFNSQNLLVTKDPYFNRAYSADFTAGNTIQQFPLNLTAYNLVSNVQIVVNFGIEENITNPSIVSSKDPIDPVKGYAAIGEGDTVTFTVNAGGGTNVKVEWDYGDGTNDSVYLPTWTTTQQKTKTFNTLRWYNVVVKLSNSYSSYTKTFKILAIAAINLQTMAVSPGQALFVPPATVSITFTKNIADPAPNEATVYFDYGNGETATVPFDISQTYNYEYREMDASPYTITANVSNPISSQVLTRSVQIIEKIQDIEIITNPEHAPFGENVNVNVKIRRADTGTLLRFGWDLQDGNTYPDTDRTGVSPYGIDTKTTTYNNVQAYTLTITATSPLESITATKTIQCQRKVTRDLQLVSNHPREFVASGGTIDFDFNYATLPQPTAANIKVDYGDGTTGILDSTWLTTGSGSVHRLSHTYATDGDYITKFTLSNLVSTEVFELSSGVYRLFAGLSVIPKYKPFIPITGPDMVGFGPSSNVFQLDRPVKFHMSRTAGTFVYYSVMASNGVVVILCNKTTEDVFEIKFNETGNYNVDITINNPIDSKTVSTIVKMQNAVLDVGVTHNGQPLPTGQLKTFDITFTDPGTSTCVYVDYDDSSAEMYGDSATCSGSPYAGSATYISTFTGNSFQVSHTYAEMNTYEVKVIAFNGISTSSSSVTHVISTIDCSQPQIDIKYKTTKFWEPTEIEKQNQVRVIGETKIDCGTVLENIKQWTVEKVDPDYGQATSTIDLTVISSKTKAELNLPAKFLDVGLYKATYNMEMKANDFSNNETFRSSVHTYIKIKPSKLVANIFRGGTTKIQRGFNRMLTIDPFSNSYDPDLPAGSPQTFTNFTWYCREVGEVWPTSENVMVPYTTAQLTTPPPDNGGCFRQGPGRINTIAGSLTFDTGNMKINKTYEFKVTVYKDGRDPVETSALVSIIPGTPPEISIRCSSEKLCIPSTEGLIIAPSSRLGLLGYCTNCDAGTSYVWKFYTTDYQWTWKEVQKLEQYSDGLNSENIAIHKTLFGKFPNITKYQASITATTSTGDIGTAYTTFVINTPPSGGTCTVTPKVGTVLQTKFTVKCLGWTDANGIEEYQTYCTFKNDLVNKQVSVGTDTTYVGDMPLGPDYDDYNMNCYTRIKDTLGAVTIENLGVVQVQPMSLVNVTEMLDQMKKDLSDSFDKIAAEGNVNEINNLCLAYSTLISMASQNDSLEYDDLDIAGRETSTGIGPDYANRTSAFTTTEMDPEIKKQKMAEYEEKRNNRAQLTSQIIGALNNCTIATTSAIALTGSTMAELTQYTENCARACQEKSADLAISMTDKLDELSQTTSKEEIIEASKGLLATLANIQEAGDIHKKKPTTGDKEEVKPFAVYDTDLESPKKAMPAEVKDFEDGGDVLLQYTNEEFQEGTSAKVEQSIDKIMGIIRNVLQETLVPGEPVSITTPKMKMEIQKNNADQIANKTIAMEKAKVSLPDWCDMQPLPCDKSKPIMLQAAYTTYAPHRDSDTTSQVSKYSGSVSIDFYDDTGSTVAVKNSATPIEIQIPLDRLMASPKSQYVDPYIPDREWEYFYYHKTSLTLERSSLHVQIDMDDPSQQFLVVFRKDAFPNITSREFDFSCLVGSDTSSAAVADGSASNMCYISSDEIDGYTGDVYIGVHQVQMYEHERYRTNALVPKTFPTANNVFTTNYTITTTAAACLYYHEADKKWKSDGCNVGPKTNPDYIQCLCTHLTTFSGGWAVAPNKIDWNFVFSNADFMKNPSLYITMIVITVVYLVAVVLARRQDKKDIEKLGLTPLADNDKKDKYFYEVVVVTGMRRKAGTESKVQFILAGEDDETDVRTLSDSKRKILRRGAVDGFLMSTPRPLGTLNYLHVWHDNSGKGTLASWYLRSVVVRDVQTDQKFIFICNRWFAVEEDDGQVDRVIPVAGKEQMTEFSHLFTEKTAQSLSDGHLWFSVVARPPQSRFTRVQRVSCCLCLLYLSMLTNAMFYEKDEGTNVYTFGPFALSPEQIYIGIISNIIVFPVTFLIITLFRKSRPRHKRPSRIQNAMNNTTKRATSMTDVNPTLENTREGTLTPSVLLEQKNRPDTSLSRGYTSLSVGELARKSDGGKKKKKKLDFPWYFVIFGWILLWIATLVAGAFVLFYGIQFQDVKCKKWITSMLISFLASIFVTQPIKVILTAIVFSLIIKNPGGDDEESEEDEEKPKIANDEQLLHEDSLYSMTRPKRAAYSPPDPVLMQKARQVRMNEIKMWSVIREILFYSFFLWILMVISYRNRSELMFTYKNAMEQVFIVTNNTNHSFMKAKNQDDYWSWAKSGMGNGLRALNYYNDEQPLFLRGYINDKQSRIMGYATMRQLRISPGSCNVPNEVVGIIHECNDEYSITKQDEKSYDISWAPLTGNTTREEYRYTEASELEGYPYWGELAMYSGGGYLVRLRGNISTLRDKMSQLEQEGWIDRYTRAVFIEFTVYNPGVNLFSVSTMLAEFRPSQGIVPSYRFEPVNLFPYMNSVMLFVLACEITYLLFTLYFIFNEARNLYKHKLAYFKEFWNLVELGICGMSVTAVVIYFYRMFETNRLTEIFKVSHGNEYMKFQYVGYWSEIFSYIIGWLVFFATLKFLKLLRFNKKVCLLASTMKASAKDLLHFSIIFNIVFLAFIQLFYMIYVAHIKSFKTFITSAESGIVMMMGKFDIYEMSAAAPVLTQIFIFLYVLIITFIVVNMFLSILNESFTSVRTDNNKQCNDYEIIQFMVSRLKMWTGLGTPDKSVLKPNSVLAAEKRGPTELFPDQIDRLLNSISHIYMEKERLDELFDKNVYGKGKGADLPMYNPPSVRSLKYEKLTMVQT